MNKQERVMLKTMEKMSFKLKEDVSVDFNMGKPIQDLFDNCLNFISVNDFKI
ncbi:hypothetical protein J6G99_06030 [bacterium]|nr:hypothetical protein [bacterium]